MHREWSNARQLSFDVELAATSVWLIKQERKQQEEDMMSEKSSAESGSNGRKAPCRQSVKAREVKKAADAAKPRRQQSFAVVKQDGGGSVLKSSTVKSTASVAEDNLTAITQSALAELNTLSLEQPWKVLTVLRMATNEANFTFKKQLPNEWIHKTLVYFSNVAKSFRGRVVVHG